MRSGLPSQLASSLPPDDEENSHEHLELLGRTRLALRSAVEVEVDVSDLRPYPDQPRKFFDQESIISLSESIAAVGQAITGIIREKPGETRYELIDGERRWRAIKRIPEAQRPLYKARLINADDQVVQFLISGISNFNREGHTALEITDTIVRLRGFKFPIKDIAVLLGISEMWTRQMYGLRNLAPQVRALMDEGISEKQRLPVTAAIQISKVPDATIQVDLANRVLGGGIALPALRGEILTVAHETGAAVRVREVPAYQRFNGVKTKATLARRTASNLKTVLDAEDVKTFALSPLRATEVAAILKELEDAKKTIEACERILKPDTQ